MINQEPESGGGKDFAKENARGPVSSRSASRAVATFVCARLHLSACALTIAARIL